MGIIEQMRLDGKKGFVTGGARGIGKCTATGFAQAGAIDESIALNRRMNKIIKRFKEMSDGDLKIFVRILQDRTAIDKSCIKADGAPLYVDQNKREVTTWVKKVL